MTELFSALAEEKSAPKLASPLADRIRPQTLAEVVGQTHLIGPEGTLRRQIESDQIPSLILWGPPGSGKTTLARLIAHYTQASFQSLSAVLAGIKELKEIIEIAHKQLKFQNKRTILFVDEIHRWNKAQQDALLPHLEDGTITLIGATTENPSFEIIAPLLSRTKTYVLEPLTEADLIILLQRTLDDKKHGLGMLQLTIEPNALSFIAQSSDGDGRRALNTLEIASTLANSDSKSITLKIVEEALQKKTLRYDKSGEEHYNLISAFIKSMRGSDPDAAIYYLARMLEAGEDPLFLARRMVIFASEDVGNADPQAIQVAMSVMQAFDFVGMPEGWIPLAQGATYLASAPKSNASYRAYQKAKADVEQEGALPTPKHIRNAPTKLMKELNYGKGYQYPHEFTGNYVKEEYLPEKLQGKKYYEPTDNGYEKRIKEHLANLKNR